MAGSHCSVNVEGWCSSRMTVSPAANSAGSAFNAFPCGSTALFDCLSLRSLHQDRRPFERPARAAGVHGRPPSRAADRRGVGPALVRALRPGGVTRSDSIAAEPLGWRCAPWIATRWVGIPQGNTTREYHKRVCFAAAGSGGGRACTSCTPMRRSCCGCRWPARPHSRRLEQRSALLPAAANQGIAILLDTHARDGDPDCCQLTLSCTLLGATGGVGGRLGSWPWRGGAGAGRAGRRGLGAAAGAGGSGGGGQGADPSRRCLWGKPC